MITILRRQRQPFARRRSVVARPRDRMVAEWVRHGVTRLALRSEIPATPPLPRCGPDRSPIGRAVIRNPPRCFPNGLGGKADTNKFGVHVLRTLTLLRDLGAKSKMLISLNPAGFEYDSRRATRAMNRALEIVTAIHEAARGYALWVRQPLTR
jgi:hypothetical protein